MVPVATRCDGSDAKETNHWVAVVIDGRIGKTIYWDPFGSRVSHSSLREALLKHLRLPLVTKRVRCQVDQNSCAIWVAVFFNRYYHAAKYGHPFTMTSPSCAPYAFEPDANVAIDSRSKENQTFIDKCRQLFSASIASAISSGTYTI